MVAKVASADAVHSAPTVDKRYLNVPFSHRGIFFSVAVAICSLVCFNGFHCAPFWIDIKGGCKRVRIKIRREGNRFTRKPVGYLIPWAKVKGEREHPEHILD